MSVAGDGEKEWEEEDKKDIAITRKGDRVMGRRNGKKKIRRI